MKFRKIKLISDGLGSNGREWMRGNVWEGMVGREWTWRDGGVSTVEENMRAMVMVKQL